MGSLICLSSAPNLRCESLSRIQYVTLIIPPAIEVLFCASLILGKRGSGSKRHLLLVAEGWGYFSLALFDLLLHITPAARNSVNSFNILDIFIAATSMVPLLLYTLFLYLFASEELLRILPRRFQSITKCTLMIFIPAIPLLNEIASFIGITRLPVPGSIPVIGFSSKSDQALWTFFSSLTLALLTFQQTITFFLTCYQIIRIFIDRRRIRRTESDEAHLFNGVGWMATGIKLGIVETVIGFASMSFGSVLARRILKLLGRAFLIIGVIKGMDNVEDFRNLHNELRSRSANRPYSKSRLKPLISNPRNSTFRRLSPSEIAFHDIPRGPPLPADPFEKSPSIITFGGSPLASPKYRFSSASTNANQMYSFTQPAAYQSSGLATPMQTPTLGSQRVTVHYEHGHAPTLEMRFSAIDLPSPTVVAEDIKSRPQSEWLTSGTQPSARLLSISEFPIVRPPYSRDSPITSPKPAILRSNTTTNINTNTNISIADTSAEPRYMRDNSFIGHSRIMSASSLASDSLDVIRDLAGRFPGLPPRITAKSTDTLPTDYYLEDEFPVTGISRHSSIKTYKSGDGLASTINSVSRSNSLAKRKPVPPVPRIHNKDAGSMHGSARQEVSGYLEDGNKPAPSTYTQDSYSFASRRRSSPDTEENPFTYDGDSHSTVNLGSSEDDGCSSNSVPPAKWLSAPSRSQSTKSVDIEAYRKGVGRVPKAVSPAPSEATEQGDFGPRAVSTTSLETAWPNHTITDASFEAERATWGMNDLARIKSVGKAPQKMTPTPTHAEFLRESVTLERMGITHDTRTKADDENVMQNSDTH